MKSLLPVFCFLQVICVAAQEAPPSSDPLYMQYPVEGFIRLNDGSKLKIQGLNWLDSFHVLVFCPVEEDVQTPGKPNKTRLQLRTIAISSIKKLKGKREAFARGAAVGGAAGFGAGYLVAFAAYKEDNNKSEEENDDDRNGLAVVGGLAGAAPTALLGGLLGGIFTKQRFSIKGSPQKLLAALNKILTQ